MIDGVRVVRRGRQWTVHMHAIQRYRGRLRGRFDVVIDQINTLPFLTPLWADVPAYLMMWQLAREVWWYESRFPISAVGYALEPIYLRLYRSSRVLTFSASTSDDLRGLGFRGEISILPVGIEPVQIEVPEKDQPPTFVYVGRVAPSKRVGDIIRAFALFNQKMGTGKLKLIGDGPLAYLNKLKKLANQIGVGESIEFCGWIGGAEKQRLVAGARALVMASAREGWGLVVTESSACGTPAVVYDVPGLRDSVRHLHTGLVVKPDPQSLADGMIEMVTNPDLYERLRQAGLSWSRTLTYEAMTQAAQEELGSATLSSVPDGRETNMARDRPPPK